MLNTTLQSLWRREPFDDCGAGAHNAGILERLRLRPAVIDTSSIIYRQMFAKAKEYCKLDDMAVAHAIAVDSLRDMAEACRQFSAAPLLCFDSTQNYRKAIYADYKSGRRQSLKSVEEERVVALFPEVSKLLRSVYASAYSVQTFCVYGYESDDLVAAIVLGLTQAGFGGDIVIVSNDHDLHQLVTQGVYFADVQSGVLLTANDIRKHYKLSCGDIAPAKVIGGCKSDNVKGIPQFGAKSVSEAIAAKSFDAVTFARARRSLEDVDNCLAVMALNRQLVELPLRLPDKQMPPLWLNDKVWPKPGIPEDVVDMLQHLGVPEKMHAVFGQIDRGKSMSPIATCGYIKRVRK